MMRLLLCFIVIIECAVCFSLASQPNAHIVSQPYGICDRGLANVEVLMTGEAPFRLQYKISYQGASDFVVYTSEPFYPDLSMKTTLSHLVGNNQDDNAVIQLLKVRDKTMAETQWLDLDASEVIFFPTYRIPLVHINLPGDNCGYTASLSASDNGLKNPSYRWESPDGGVFSSTDGRTTVFTATVAGNYTIQLEESNGVCQSTAETELSILGYPKGTIAGNAVICTAPENTDPRRLEIAVTLSGTAPFHYVLSDGTKRTTNLASETLVLQPNKAGDIVLASITDGNNCVAPPQDRKGAAVVVDRLPTANAGPDVHVCDSVAVLNAMINSPGNIGQWHFLDPADGEFLSGQNEEMATIRSKHNGIVNLRWSEININGSHCPSHDYVSARFDLPVKFAYAGSDTILYLEDRYRMRGYKQPWERGAWTLVSGIGRIAQDDDPQTEVDNLSFGLHKFRWTVGNGICPTLFSEVAIEVKGLTWPNGFSPNGDGVNDQLVILGAQRVNNNELVVYDLKGKVVFRVDNYKNDWQGKDLHGRDLPDGFYFYVFSGDHMAPVKETLVIKRSKF